MKSTIFITIIVILSLVGCATAPSDNSAAFQHGLNDIFSNATQEQTYKIAVLPLVDFRTEEQDALSSYLSSDVIFEITRAFPDRFTILERDLIESILAEFEFSLMSGMISEDEVAEFGRMSGADYLIIGTKLELERSIQVNLRLVDVESAEIIGVARIDLAMEEKYASLIEDEDGTSAVAMADEASAQTREDSPGEPADVDRDDERRRDDTDRRAAGEDRAAGERRADTAMEFAAHFGDLHFTGAEQLAYYSFDRSLEDIDYGKGVAIDDGAVHARAAVGADTGWNVPVTYSEPTSISFDLRLGDRINDHPPFHINLYRTGDQRLCIMLEEDAVLWFYDLSGQPSHGGEERTHIPIREWLHVDIILAGDQSALYVDGLRRLVCAVPEGIHRRGTVTFECHNEFWVDNLEIDRFAALETQRGAVGPETGLDAVGDALPLNGVDMAVHIPYGDPMVITEEITIEALFAIDRFDPEHRRCGFMPGTIHGIISQSSDVSWAGNYSLGVSRFGAFFMFERDAYDSHYIVDFDIQEGLWYHVAFSHTFGRGDDAVMLINGRVIPGRWVDNAGRAIDGNARIDRPSRPRPFMVGRIGDENPESRHFFPGAIDELRVWNRRRTPAEIAQNMHRSLDGSQVGLVANFPFDEGLTSLNTAYDAIRIQALEINMPAVGTFYARGDSNFHSVPVRRGHRYEVRIRDEWSGYEGRADVANAHLFFSDRSEMLQDPHDPIAVFRSADYAGNPYVVEADRTGYLIVYTQSDNPGESSYEITVAER